MTGVGHPNFNDGRWPHALDPRTICLSCDVEWAAPAVLDDLRRLLDERNLAATFFCTHAGIDVGRHERGLHPNFRRNGDTMRLLRADKSANTISADDSEVFRHVIGTTLGFAPEAKGVRGHSLHYDSVLVGLYRQFGLEYDSTYQIPLVEGLRPFWKEYDLLELPIYFNDYFELKSGAVGFDATALKLDRPGLKVIDLHPNLVFINAASDQHYLSCKAFYHDEGRLLAVRHPERGIRTMVVEMLDHIAAKALPTARLGEVNKHWRAAHETR
jgi:hypothetical protein